MHINNPHLKKLAEGRTEITTKMICEAERLEDAPRLEYMRFMAEGMKNIYGTDEYYRQQLYYFACIQDYGRLKICPYCGK